MSRSISNDTFRDPKGVPGAFGAVNEEEVKTIHAHRGRTRRGTAQEMFARLSGSDQFGTLPPPPSAAPPSLPSVDSDSEFEDDDDVPVPERPAPSPIGLSSSGNLSMGSNSSMTSHPSIPGSPMPSLSSYSSTSMGMGSQYSSASFIHTPYHTPSVGGGEFDLSSLPMAEECEEDSAHAATPESVVKMHAQTLAPALPNCSSFLQMVSSHMSKSEEDRLMSEHVVQEAAARKIQKAWMRLRWMRMIRKLARLSRNRTKLLKEIVSTEKTYLDSLDCIIGGFCVPLERRGGMGLSEADMRLVFSNVKNIAQLHGEFCYALENRMQHCSFWSTLGDLFLKFVPSMKFYSDFINAYDEGMSLMMEATKKNKELNEYLNICKSPSGLEGMRYLESLLIAPIQRLPRYVLLLKELLKMTPDDHPDKQAIVDAQSAVQAVAKHVNESKRAHEARKYVKVLHPTGKDLNHTKRRRMAEIQKMSVMGDKVEERLYDGSASSRSRSQSSEKEKGGGSFLSPTALISRVGGGRKPVRDYHTLKLVDPSSFRDILFEMPVLWSTQIDKRVFTEPAKGKVFVFNDCLGIAVNNPDPRKPYKFEEFTPWRDRDKFIKMVECKPRKYQIRVHASRFGSKLKSRPEREGGAVKPMAAKLKVLQITTVDDVLHLLCVKTYEELGALQSELQKGINLAAEENE